MANSNRPDFPPEDPTLARTPVVFTTTHRALGMTIVFGTNDQRIRQAAVDTYGPIIELGEIGPQPDAQISVFVHHVDEEPGFDRRQALIRTFDGTFWIAASRASVIGGSAETGKVSGFVSETIANDLHYLRSVMIQSAFLQVAHPRALVAVHSACLARDGRSVILRGDSGAGKSTLAYAALRRGYALVAEDVIFLYTRSGQNEGRINPGDIELRGLPWTLHLLPDAVRLFPELAAVPTFQRPDGRYKLGITIEDTFPGQALSQVPLGPLVFVRRGHLPTPRLRCLSRAESLALLEATAIHYERDEDAEHGIWDAFLSQPVYLLETSADPERNASMLDHVLERSEAYQ